MTPAAGGAPAVGGSSPGEPRAPGAPGAAGTRLRADVCVYGGTAAGVMAALAVAAAARSVVLVEPSRWLGGFVGGGIRVLRDCRYPDEVGGRMRTMMERDFLLGGGAHDRQAALRALFAELVGQAAVSVLFEHRLGRVALAGNRIRTLHLDLARPDRDGPPAAYPEAVDVVQVSAEVFIDAGYEGDLLAAAGVSYACGREAARGVRRVVGGSPQPARVRRRPLPAAGRLGQRPAADGLTGTGRGAGFGVALSDGVQLPSALGHAGGRPRGRRAKPLRSRRVRAVPACAAGGGRVHLAARQLRAPRADVGRDTGPAGGISGGGLVRAPHHLAGLRRPRQDHAPAHREAGDAVPGRVPGQRGLPQPASTSAWPGACAGATR